MTRTLTRGLIAGATGTTVLGALGYLDMAVRGRPASTLPALTVEALGDRLGVSSSVPKKVREPRHAAMGAIGGMGAGLAVGVLASAARRWGFRPGRLVGTVATAAAAMAATDLPAAALGVTDPRTWTPADWVSDAVPHLGYGLAVDAVLRHDPTPEAASPAAPARAGLLLRSAALGAAAGSRSTLGVAAPVFTRWQDRSTAPLLTRREHALARLPKALLLCVVGAEVAGDKLPQTPSRLKPPVLGVRLTSGASGGVALARRAGALPAGPAVAGLLGAAAGSFGGFAWRTWADRRVPDWQAALAEDAAAVLLALAATLPGRVPQSVPELSSVPAGAAERGGHGVRRRRRHDGVGDSGSLFPSGESAPEGTLPEGAPSRFRTSPGTFPGLRAYRPSRRRNRRRED
jgi:uncharacterized membrane protein